MSLQKFPLTTAVNPRQICLDRSNLRKSVLKENRNAIAAVLQGKRAVVKNTSTIIAFLDSFAEKSPPSLKFLVYKVKSEIVASRRRNEPICGFKLEG
jgi:hypothetical protein